MTARPPTLAERLLSWTLRVEDRDAILGDLAEEFSRRALDEGSQGARRWYWRQVRMSGVSNVAQRLSDARAARVSNAGGAMRDIRDAFRSLRASPSFTLAALIVLTLGIGASTAIFSVVDAVVLRDLPVGHSDQLMVVGHTRPNVPGLLGLAAPDFIDLAAKQDAFDGWAASTGGGTMKAGSAQSGPGAETIRVVRVTANLFATLQVRPHLGSPFSAANEFDGADHVAVLSDGFWRRHFGGDRSIVGQSFMTDKGSWQVAGVMPAGFSFPIDAAVDVWVPLVIPPADHARTATGYHSSYDLKVIGRLKDGITEVTAQARVSALGASLAAQYPSWFKDWTPVVRPLRQTVVGADIRNWMLMLLAAVTFVLLIACVNVASLMLARASARSREISVRAALGASRWQLVRSVLTESLVLSVAGTAAGVGAAFWAIDVIRTLLPANVPRSASIAVNWRVLTAAAIAAVVTGLICGVLPALQASRANLNRALRQNARSGSATRSRQRLRAVLVAAEVGLAIVLLIGAGLFMSSFVRLTSVDLGLKYDHVLTVSLGRVDPRPPRGTPIVVGPRMMAILHQALATIQSMPSVESAAALSGTRPFEDGYDRTNVFIPGREQQFQTSDDAVDVYAVTASYTTVLGVPLIRGRIMRAEESMADAPVVVLNQTAAARYFPGVDAVGQTIRIYRDRTVIGVVGDVRSGGPEAEVRPQAYLPFTYGGPDAFVVVKTKDTKDPAASVAAVKSAILAAAPGLQLGDIRTLGDFLGRLIAPRKFNMLLVGLFGALALAIATVGIYGVMAFIVEQRRAEIGIRMALGAQRREVVGVILRRALAIVSAGLLAGLAVAWPMARLLQSFLFRVQPHDAIVYAGASLLLLAAGVAAALGPARRASSVDPVIALRAE
jgi:putative ABC transport system permease protein